MTDPAEAGDLLAARMRSDDKAAWNECLARGARAVLTIGVVFAGIFLVGFWLLYMIFGAMFEGPPARGDIADIAPEEFRTYAELPWPESASIVRALDSSSGMHGDGMMEIAIRANVDEIMPWLSQMAPWECGEWSRGEVPLSVSDVLSDKLAVMSDSAALCAIDHSSRGRKWYRGLSLRMDLTNGNVVLKRWSGVDPD